MDFGDINPFVLILTNFTAWQQTFPGCPPQNGDIDGNGAVDFGDINPFVALVIAKSAPVPVLRRLTIPPSLLGRGAGGGSKRRASDPLPILPLTLQRYFAFRKATAKTPRAPRTARNSELNEGAGKRTTCPGGPTLCHRSGALAAGRRADGSARNFRTLAALAFLATWRFLAL